MNKVYFLIIGLILLVAGCTTNLESAVEGFVKTLPQVEKFLSDYPEASLVITYWTESEVNQTELNELCQKEITPQDMWKVTVSKDSVQVIAWVDYSADNLICLVKIGEEKPVCEENITYAMSPSGQCQEFLTTCIPADWAEVAECPSEAEVETIYEEVKKECPSNCDDDNPCTTEWCNESSNFKCEYEKITPCCGNTKCEQEEDCLTCLEDCECQEHKVCAPERQQADSSDGCYTVRCGDYICEGYETCSSCPEDCGECPSIECGNGVCESGETCSNCPDDCLSSEQVCCNSVAYTGGCCSDADCGTGYSCINYNCQVSESDTEPPIIHWVKINEISVNNGTTITITASDSISIEAEATDSLSGLQYYGIEWWKPMDAERKQSGFASSEELINFTLDENWWVSPYMEKGIYKLRLTFRDVVGNSITNTYWINISSTETGEPEPTCGDGSCNGDETCTTCPSDCLNSGQICCDGVAYTGDCCSNDDCESEQVCSNRECITEPEEVCNNTRTSCCSDSDCTNYCEGLIRHYSGTCSTIGSACSYLSQDCAYYDNGSPVTGDCIMNSCSESGCIHEDIIMCVNDDGCCPSGCYLDTDNDCTTCPEGYVYESGFCVLLIACSADADCDEDNLSTEDLCINPSVESAYCSNIDGKILHLGFEDAGDIVSDDSVYSNDGVNYGALHVEGVKGNALRFNLFDSDDYVEIPFINAYNMNKDFTIFLWFNMQGDNSDWRQSIFSKYDHYTFERVYERLGLTYRTDSGWYTAMGAPTLDANKWYNGVMTYDGNSVKLYLNGVLDGEKSETLDITSAGDYSYVLGRFPVYNHYFNGTIDEVYVFNKVLTPDEINDLISATNVNLDENYCAPSETECNKPCIPIGCSSNSDCDDGNPSTEDICYNPNQCGQYCANTPITS